MRKQDVCAVLRYKYEFYRDQVIAKIRELGPECRQSGDDSPLKDVWEEFKDQVQQEESVVFDAYVETIEAICHGLVVSLPQHELQLLWLDTGGYFDRDDDRIQPHADEIIEGVERELYQRVVSCAADEGLSASKATVASSPQPLFVRGYHNLPGISEGEELDYYCHGDLSRLQSDLASYLKHQLDLFSHSEFEEYFSLAEYPEVDSLDDLELAVFRSALAPADRSIQIESVHPLDVFRGLRAVIDYRIKQGDHAGLRNAVELFNSVMESALNGIEFQDPRSSVKLHTAKEFAAPFIDRLIETVDWFERPHSSDGYREAIGRAFSPLKPLLIHLQSAVHHERWPHSDFVVGKLLLIVDHYKQVIEDQSVRS